MPVDAINSTSSSASTNSFAALSTTDFIRVLMTELQQQDPFDPQDSGALLEQLSSLRNIESQMSLQEKLGELVLQNQIASAGGMIGRFVEGLDITNHRVNGVVTSVRVTDEEVILELDSGATLNMSRVELVAEPAAA